jgi:hypothetical protein
MLFILSIVEMLFLQNQIKWQFPLDTSWTKKE